MAQKIFITGKYGAGKCVTVDDEDYEILNRHKWKADEHGYPCRNAYVETINNKHIYRNLRMNRFIVNAPDDKWVDHKDGDIYNNQKSNLRICTPSQNNMNSRVKSSSQLGVKGVSKTKNGKFYVRINIDGKSTYIGRFHTLHDAKAAYAQAAMKYHGDFLHRDIDPTLKGAPRIKLGSNNSSGYKGVDWHKASGKWRASMTINGQSIYLGVFTDIDDARSARLALEEHFGGKSSAP